MKKILFKTTDVALQSIEKNEVIHRSYLRVKVDALKEKYIKALPFIVVEDIYRAKTELEVIKEENYNLKKQNEKINELWNEINDMKIRQSTWEELKREVK